MLITGKSIDDFKTARKDVTPPLPLVLRLVPISFYCSIVVSIVLGVVFFLQYQQAAKKRDTHNAQVRKLTAQKDEARNQRIALETQIKLATDIESWVNGARPIQPLIVEIQRSMTARSNIVDLRVDRDVNSPAQLKFAIKLGTDTAKQLDVTIDKIATQHYRAVSPQQTLGRGELDYSATLIRQHSSPAASPQPAKSP